MKKFYSFVRALRNLPLGRFALALGVIMLATTTYAQEITITGNVAGDDGETLPGVNIVEKGTSNGTISDFDGNYQLVVNQGATLIYSFVGYKTKEVVVGTQSTINVVLSLDIAELQEVVVVGYGAVEKKDMTGVVAKIDNENFNKGAITNPAELLAGKAAGVSVTPTGGPGNAPEVRIRGRSSINANSDPLYVVDGVILDNTDTPPGQRSPLNFLNTEDIENITVLKDASAAAIYGSRGAKGVIIITTKKGQSGAPRISYDAYYSTSQIQESPDILTAEEFRTLVQSNFPNQAEELGDANTDWVDAVTQTATGVKHAISLSSGDKVSDVYVSLMHQTLNGVMRKDQIERNIFSMNYNRRFYEDAVELKIVTKNSFLKNSFPEQQMGAATDMNPTLPIRDPNSIYGGYYEQITHGGLGVQNPVARQDLTTNIGRSFRNISKAEMIFKPKFIEGLTWTNNLSVDVTTSKNRFFQSLDMVGVYQKGSLTFDESLKTSVLVESYGNYKKQFDDHSIDFTAGYSFQTFNFEKTNFFADTLSDGKYTRFDLSPATLIKTDLPTYNKIVQRSYFGRVNYTFKDKYLATLNFRADGSSQFGKSNRYGFFPSVALGWRIYDESFAGFLKGAFDDMKIRAGWGRLGNQEFAPYLYKTFYFSSTNDARYQFGNQFYNLTRPRAVDPDIKWEQTETYNIGLDYTFKGGRVYGSLEVYRRNTDDLLFETIIPAGINLAPRLLTNVGSMVNEGIELELSSVIIDNSKLNWKLSFNAAHNRNEITDLGGTDRIVDLGSIISGDVGQFIQVIQEGESILTFNVREHIYENGLPMADGGFVTPIDMYVDQNDDGIINEDDLVAKKNALPTGEFGLTSNTSYGDFNLSFTLRSKVGNYVYNNVASSKGFFNRLSPAGSGINNLHRSVIETRFTNHQLFSDYYLENASFLKLDNITLSYNFNKLSFMKMRLYVTAQNVLTITGYSGLDPEISNGIDNNLYPRALNLIGGINLTF